MKSTITFILVLCVCNLYAQNDRNIKARINSHFWAGGVCCSNGHDISITIFLDQKFNKCFDSALVEVDGIRVMVAERSFTKTILNDSIVQLDFKFGWSNNSHSDPHDSLTPNYYGIELRDVVFIGELSSRITLISNHNTVIISDLESTRSMTAYP